MRIHFSIFLKLVTHGFLVFSFTGCGKGFQVTKLSSTLDSSQSKPQVALSIEEPAANALVKSDIHLTGQCAEGLVVIVSGTGVSSQLKLACVDSTYSADIVFSEGDGTKSVTVSQPGKAGQQIEVTRTFLVDRGAPGLQILIPPENTVANSGLTVGGVCEAGIPVQIFGSDVSASQTVACANGQFSAPILFSTTDGPKLISISQTDAAGNNVIVVGHYIRDSAPPVLSITGPTTNTTSASGLTLTGACETGLDVHLSGTGTAAALLQPCVDAAFSIPFVFSSGDGTKNITVTQTDAAGNTASASRSFSRQSVGPSISISSPAADAIFKTGATIQGTCTTGLPVVVSGSGINATANVTCSNAAFSVAVTFSAGDGSKNVTVSQTNAAALVGMDSRNFIKDTTGPNLAITLPTTNAYVPATVSVVGTCESGLTVSLGGSGLAASATANCLSGTFTASVNLSAGDGNKQIQVSQTDSVGNASTQAVTVKRDGSAPNPQITSPAAATVAASGLTVSGTCETGLPLVVTGQISALANQTCNAGAFSVAVVFAGADGTKTVTVSQTDAAGNTGSSSRNFVRQGVGPSISISSPAVDSKFKTGTTIQGTCTNGLPIVVGGTGISAPANVTCTNGAFSAAITFSAGDGTKNVTVSQTNASSQVGMDNRSFIKDTTAPNLAMTLPLANAYVPATVTVAGTCETGLNVTVSGSGLAAQSSATCLSGTFSASVNLTTGDGSKLIQISQTDSVGNAATQSVTVQRDGGAPNPQITAPAAATVAASGLTISGTCETGLPLVVSGQISAVANQSCNAGTFSVPVVFAGADGTKTVTVSQTDAAGNIGSSSRSFSRQSVAPSIAISAPAADSKYKTGLTIQGTCTNGLPIVVGGSGIMATANATCASGTFSVAVTFSGSDGTKNVTVSQTNAAALVGMDSRNFIKDTTAPNLNIASPAANALVQAAVTVAGTCETGLAVSLSGTGLAAQSSVNCTNGMFSASVNVTSGDGDKLIQASQTDSVGNSTTKSVTVRRDGIAPNPQITSPVAGTVTASDVTLAGTCETGLAVSVTGSVAAVASQTCSGAGTFSVTVTLSGPDGAKTVTVSQTDTAGNTGSSSRSFTKTSPTPVLDGSQLYATNCSACHGALEVSSKRGRSVSQITSAIAGISNMAHLTFLTTEQKSAIAQALSLPTVPQVCNADMISKPALRRLNSREFANSIRDLLGITVDVTLLPKNDLNGAGYDTDGSILRIIDLDAEKYLDVIQTVVTQLFASPVRTGFDFTCDPAATETTKRSCTSTKLSMLARRAFKRVLSAAELKRFVDFARLDVDVTEGLKNAMTAMLMSPDFLYLNYNTATATGSVYTLTDLELAHRLALMLWSSVPDETLIASALAGQLKASATLRAQVLRMVGDAKFNTGLGIGFVDMWLELYKLGGVSRVDSALPSFTTQYIDDMIQESRLFVQYLIKNDRPLSELLTSQQSFVNQRLAQIYGVTGSFSTTTFSQISLPASQRSGILTLPSIMTLTGKLDSTSPVKRGFWVTKRVLCSEPPPPPPNIPVFDPNPSSTLTVKERLALHRTNTTCASCHAQMDPIGIGLENLSQIGKWRTSYGASAVDATETFEGVGFNGPVQLGSILAQNESVKECITGQLANYTLGRAIETGDKCYVKNILEKTSTTSTKGMLTLIQELTDSALFRQQRLGD